MDNSLQHRHMPSHHVAHLPVAFNEVWFNFPKDQRLKKVSSKPWHFRHMVRAKQKCGAVFEVSQRVAWSLISDYDLALQMTSDVMPALTAVESFSIALFSIMTIHSDFPSTHFSVFHSYSCYSSNKRNNIIKTISILPENYFSWWMTSRDQRSILGQSEHSQLQWLIASLSCHSPSPLLSIC